ncbi:hypothetical protein [Aquimarina sp. I32.4]|uniref:hypothetical protein n=1 Tax=Aquimarina sp. I32.4 TaxID=2053903 RepID=UPI000CDE9445|nr:hypothetical protein [Aquimarina sp. I32.4]
MLNRIVNTIEKSEVQYPSYALLRSILALSTLLTIIINSTDILFPVFIENNNLVYSKIIISNINFSNLIFENIFWFKIIAIVVLLLVISGIYPRITGVLHFLISYLFFNTSIAIDGGDQICSNITFLLIPMTLIDNNINHWGYSRKMNSTFGKTIFCSFSFLICIQICVVYLHSAIAKFNVEEWVNGTAIWYWFRHEIFGANYFILTIVNFCLQNSYVLYFFNYSVIVLEILIAMMLFVDKRKFLPKIIFTLSVSFHLLIILIHGIFSFALIMIGCLAFYFNKKIDLQWKSSL